MARERVSVRLDRQTREKLNLSVQATGKTESEVVREALANYLQEQTLPETCLELARREKLIGCAKALPKDLSTNRAHFEGFGK